MSLIFGIRNAKRTIVRREHLVELSKATEDLAPEGIFLQTHGHLGMGIQPFHTTTRSLGTSGPYTDIAGNMIVIDGRLDNHDELQRRLNIDGDTPSDSQLILAAFQRWGESCFSMLIGDWAIALWSHADDALFLARDHAGTRCLYFKQSGESITWSSSLASLRDGQTFPALNREYAIRFILSRPNTEITPYEGLETVPAASYCCFRERNASCTQFWSPLEATPVQRPNHHDYDEEFKWRLQTSVRRRIVPGPPIVAQLSGGMDSSSIVCIADQIAGLPNTAPDKLLDTISYFDETESNWDERPYFTAVEAVREKQGIHIDVSDIAPTFVLPDNLKRAHLFPGIDSATILLENKLQAAGVGTRYKCILSGLGGDELLGGVPSALPELANYLSLGRLPTLFKRALQWCLVDRTPMTHLLAETIRFTISLYANDSLRVASVPPWLRQDDLSLLREMHVCSFFPAERFWCLPSVRSNAIVWRSLLGTLPHLIPSQTLQCEYRYPYLDKDFVDFALRIPRDVLIAPGRRRLLMRRALKGIVPEVILERRRKGFTVRGPQIGLIAAKSTIETLLNNSLIVDQGFVEPKSFNRALSESLRGNQQWTRPVVRTLALEIWLRLISATIKPTLSFQDPCSEALA